MKKIIMTCMAAVMVCGTAMAQGQPQDNRRGFNKEEMAKRHTEMMAQRYGLDESQKAKLLELNLENSDMMRPMMPPRPEGMRRPEMGKPEDQAKAGDNNNERRQRPNAERKGDNEMKQGDRPPFPGQGRPGGFDPEKRKAYEEALSKIMTEEQYAKYQEDMKNRRQFRPQRPQNGQ